MLKIRDFSNATSEEIISRTKLLVNRNVTEFIPDSIKINIKDKGDIGNLIQEYWYGIKRNSVSEPDFNKEGIELKMVPLVRYKIKNKVNEYRIKERTKITSINYKTIINENWLTSSVKKKINKILFVFMIDDKSDKDDLMIVDFLLYEFDNRSILDKSVIKSDWERLHSYVLQSQIDLISEINFDYLSPSTSGNSKLVSLPFSTVQIKERSFSFKSSYTRTLLNEHRGTIYSSIESLQKINSFSDLENFLIKKLSTLYGMTLKDIENKFKIKNRNSLNKYSLIIKDILGLDVDKDVEEFEKFNIKIRVIRVNPNTYLPHQSISFSHQTLKSILEEESFEESELSENITKIMFVVLKSEYKKADKPELLIFDKVCFWSPSIKEYSNIKEEYNKYKKIIGEGVVVRKLKYNNKKGFIYTNNLPGMSETKYIHMRPHGSDNSDLDNSIDNLKIPKQCFWLNKKFVKDIISNQTNQ
jgi:DNA mismatch repair protein MutH